MEVLFQISGPGVVVPIDPCCNSSFRRMSEIGRERFVAVTPSAPLRIAYYLGPVCKKWPAQFTARLFFRCEAESMLKYNE